MSVDPKHPASTSSDNGTPAGALFPELRALPEIDEGKNAVYDSERRRKGDGGLGGRTMRSALHAEYVHERRYHPGDRVDESGKEQVGE